MGAGSSIGISCMLAVIGTHVIGIAYYLGVFERYFEHLILLFILWIITMTSEILKIIDERKHIKEV